MTDLTLRREGSSPNSAVNGLLDLLGQLFRATPLGLVVAAFTATR